MNILSPIKISTIPPIIGAEFFKSLPNFLPMKKPSNDKHQVIIPIITKDIIAVVIL